MESCARDPAGWPAFWVWAASGALCTFTLLRIATAGFYVLPLAVLSLGFAVEQRGRTRLGAVTGVGISALAIGVLRLDPGAAPAYVTIGVLLIAAGLIGFTLLCIRGRATGRRAIPHWSPPR